MLKTVKKTTIVTLAAITLAAGISTQASAETTLPSATNSVTQVQTQALTLSDALITPESSAATEATQVARFRSRGFRGRGFNRGFRSRGFNRGFRGRGFNRGFRSRGFNRGFSSRGFGGGFHHGGFSKFKYYY